MIKEYHLEIYRKDDAYPYVEGVALDGWKRVTFFKTREGVKKKDTDTKGLTALLGEVRKLIEDEGIGEYTIRLKVRELKDDK